jgi:hypothetical protein
LEHDDADFVVVGPSFNLMKDPFVPFPGVPDAAIPCRFTAEVRDRENGCTAQLEVVVDEGRPRIRSFTVRAEGDPLTPTELRRLPLGAYLDAVVTVSVTKVTQVTEEVFRIAPFTDMNDAAGVTEAAKRSRRQRQPVTRERLVAAATAYQEAPARRKSEHVAKELDVDSSYARQLIYKAREAGLLPPTGRKG